ncbi:hypothetical protein CVT25_010956 [Psilocybe cyanescens]|uniref:Uncharacterized protein n=1 Tax=Psilocybe cyanescens TaxID=93625 RepID=A0A409WFS0_PSICY|nr:hypothetical protein CVT25_010956 [Psilocybe cyanescens]
MDRTPYQYLPIESPNLEGVALPHNNSGVSSNALDPGYGPQTIHRSDLFFINSTPHMNTRKKPEFPQLPLNASPSNQLYPYHQQSFNRYVPQPQSAVYPTAYSQSPVLQHDYHRQRAATVPELIPPPLLPPKPIVYPSIGQNSMHNESPSYPPPPLPPPPPFSESVPEPSLVAPPVDDSNELAIALALSQSESVQRKILEDQEEQDLARALMESMLSTGSNLQSTSNPFFASPSDPPPIPTTTKPSPVPPPANLPQTAPQYNSTSPPVPTPESLSKSADPSQFGRYDKWRIPEKPSADILESEPESRSSVSTKPDFSLTSASREPLPPEAQKTPPVRPLSVSSSSSLPYTLPSPRAAAFGDVDSQKDGSDFSIRPRTSPIHGPPSQESDSTSQAPPDTVLVFDDEAYARQLAAEEEEIARQELQSYNDKRKALEAARDDQVEQAAPAYISHGKQPQWQPPEIFIPPSEPYQFRDSVVPRSVEKAPASVDPSSSSYSSVAYPSIGSRRDSESDTFSMTSRHSSARSSASVPVGQPDRPAHRRRPSIGSMPQADSRTSGNGHQPPVAGLLNPNQFLDRELLVGVTIGFKPPAISTRLLPMQDPMPNIISIPYSRCPPLHFQAPDWRHLLRLMARLSGTRIEPTVEAMAVTRADLRLRTVVQFIKPNPSSTEWRTILWFTVDHPVPPNAPGAARYTAGNPNLLPWSYSLSPIPMLLRDAADTQISKSFTIPESETVPLPNLPITFPNLALYLQAALDDSRQYSHDPLSLGKLGKMVQTCYPSAEQEHPEFDGPGKSTVGHLFKRVMGRGNKDKKKGKATNNEETYQLVTPFVPDEWG